MGGGGEIPEGGDGEEKLKQSIVTRKMTAF